MPCTRKRTSSSLRASSSKTRMNVSPMRLRFFSGSVTPASCARKRSLRLHVHERHLEVVAERLDDLLGLAVAQQAVVDEHARQLVADRAVHEQRRDGGVDAAREAADDALVADLLADALDLLVDHGERRPRRGRVAGVGRGSSCSMSVPRGVCRPRGGTARRRARARGPPSPRSARRGDEAVTPKPSGARTTASLWLIQHVVDVARGRANSTPPRVGSSAVLPNSAVPVRPTSPPSARGHGLHAVADAEHRDPELEQAGSSARRARLVDRAPGRRRGSSP